MGMQRCTYLFNDKFTNSRTPFIIAFFVVFVLMMSWRVSALPVCNSTIYEMNSSFIGCEVQSSLTLQSGIYRYNMSTNTGVIVFNSDNAVLDGNGSWLIGNSTRGYGIQVPSLNQTNRIINFNITGYIRAISVESSGHNTEIINNTISNSSVSISSANKILFRGNYLINSTLSSDSGDNHRFLSNTFGGCNRYCYNSDTVIGLLSTSAAASPSPNISFMYNIVESAGIGLLLRVNVTNTTIYHNTFKNNDIAIHLLSTPPSTIIYNNTFLNNTFEYDGYSTSIRINGVSFVNISFNNFSAIGTNAIWFQNSHNISILNNTFDFLSLQEKQSTLARDYGYPPCAISSAIDYKTYLTAGNDIHPSWNVTNSTSYRSENITVLGNIFDSDTQCYLRTQGEPLLNHDISLYWQRTFQIPSYMFEIDNFYLNNNFNNLSSLLSNGLASDILNQALTMVVGGTQNTGRMVKYRIYKSYLYFNNTNASTTYQLNLFNQSSTFIYNFSNKSFIAQSFTGNINVSLSPSQEIYVIDQPTLHLGSGGLTDSNLSLIDATINITQSGDSYSIKSSSSTPFNSTVIVPSVSCSKLRSAVYTSNTGAYNQQTGWTCSDSEFRWTPLTIEQASSSNELQLDYYSTDLQSGILSGMSSAADLLPTSFQILIVILFVLLLFGAVGYFLNRADVDIVGLVAPSENITVLNVVIWSVLLGILVILFSLFAKILAGV